MDDRNRPEFDKSMDEVLLKNGFKYWDDWEFGPISGWEQDWDRYSLKLARHNFGYYLIISAHRSGENPKFNMGSSNSADEIIKIRDALKGLF